MKEVDEEFTHTEVSEVKTELSKEKQCNRLLEERYDQLSQHFAVLEKAVEELSKRKVLKNQRFSIHVCVIEIL